MGALNRHDAQHVAALEAVHLPGHMIAELNGIDSLAFIELNGCHEAEMPGDAEDLAPIIGIGLDARISITGTACLKRMGGDWRGQQQGCHAEDFGYGWYLLHHSRSSKISGSMRYEVTEKPSGFCQIAPISRSPPRA